MLTANNREDGMVEFLHAGATLTNEFFSESVRRQDFGTVEAYTCFLATSQVRHVVFSTEYLERADHDEASLLVAMTKRGTAALEYDGVDGLAYAVDPPASAVKESPRACGI